MWLIFQHELDYRFLINSHLREDNRNIELGLVSTWLTKRGISAVLITRVLRQLDQAASLSDGEISYDDNKDVYRLLRYGVKAKKVQGNRTKPSG